MSFLRFLLRVFHNDTVLFSVVIPFLLHRPEWDENMTTEELDQQERESFLEWRRQLAQ